MRSAAPLIVSWQGRQLRVRHDDPRIGTYTPTGARLGSAVELASMWTAYDSSWRGPWGTATGSAWMTTQRSD